ncbi:MAG: hypothetical protein ABIW84_01665 [Ilumatobacteraceae bacterium]
MIEQARQLFVLAPADFVAERNRLAKELRAAGRTEDARSVAELKRPKLAEHGLNLLARNDPPVMNRLIAAIAAASDAQSAAIGGRATGLREATAELRSATVRAVDAAVALLSAEGGSGEGQRDEIVALIRVFVAGGDVGLLHEGLVGSADPAARVQDADDYFRGAPDPPRRTRAAAGRATTASTTKHGATKHPNPPKKALPPPPVGPSPADRARKMKLERQVREADVHVERAERSVVAADDELRAAQAKRDERAAVLADKQRDAAAARAELDAHDREWSPR